MEIREPTTMITDYLLAGLALWLARRLFQEASAREPGAGWSPIRWWAGSFVALAVGAIAGGTAHGFAAYLGELGRFWTWKITVYSIGATSLAFLFAAALAYLRGGARRLLMALAAAQFAIYAWWMASHDDFRYVIYDYAPAMLVVLALALWRSRQDPSGVPVAAGIVVSFAAAAVQMTGWVWHKYFNHNDLYHLIQMVGLWLLYRGGLSLRLRRNP